MRRLAFAAFLPLALLGSSTVAARRTTTITIEARGAAMEFRTFGLGNFTVADGQSRRFVVKPGTYTVVQAPPVGVSTQVAPDQYVITNGVLTECSDGELHVHDVRLGSAVRCTYTTQQIP